MNGYGLWDQWYGLTPEEQAAQRAHEQALAASGVSYYPSVQSTYYPKDPSLDPNYSLTRKGGFTGSQAAWTIDSEGNVIPSSKTDLSPQAIEAQKQKELRESYTGPVTDLRSNAFSDFTARTLQSDPEMAYLSSVTGGEFGEKSPAKRRFFESSFEDIYAGYVGEQAKQVRAAQGQVVKDPIQFTDYLKGDPFTERYGKLTPSERGEYLGKYSPKTRHIYY